MADQKTEAELAQLKAGLVDERMDAKERELELLITRNTACAKIMKLQLENKKIEKKSYVKWTWSWT